MTGPGVGGWREGPDTGLSGGRRAGRVPRPPGLPQSVPWSCPASSGPREGPGPCPPEGCTSGRPLPLGPEWPASAGPSGCSSAVTSFLPSNSQAGSRGQPCPQPPLAPPLEALPAPIPPPSHPHPWLGQDAPPTARLLGGGPGTAKRAVLRAAAPGQVTSPPPP